MGLVNVVALIPSLPSFPSSPPSRICQEAIFAHSFRGTEFAAHLVTWHSQGSALSPGL